MPIANVYVDGFNLYFGALRNTPYRWLDIVALSRRLLRDEVALNRVRYFTARVVSRPDDPTAAERQETYLRALGTLPEVSIHFGQFLTNPTSLPLADGSGVARVLRTEEKGSDVNLATYLILDALSEECDTALVVSNDTDLLVPIREVRARFGTTIGVACPVYHRDRHPSVELVNATDFNVHITRRRRGALRSSQFSAQLTDGEGRTISKPPGW